MSNINPVLLVRPESYLKPFGVDSVKATPVSFEQVLGKALGEVNDIQQQSAELPAKMVNGELEYVHQATAMSEKATMALQLTIQVRNKVVEAYQEIMRTQL